MKPDIVYNFLIIYHIYPTIYSLLKIWPENILVRFNYSDKLGHKIQGRIPVNLWNIKHACLSLIPPQTHDNGASTCKDPRKDVMKVT